MQSQGITHAAQFWEAPRRRETDRRASRHDAAAPEDLGPAEAKPATSLNPGAAFLDAFPRVQRQIVAATLVVSVLYLAFAAGFFLRFLEAGAWAVNYARYPAEARLFTGAVGGGVLILSLLWGAVAGSVLALRRR